MTTELFVSAVCCMDKAAMSQREWDIVQTSTADRTDSLADGEDASCVEILNNYEIAEIIGRGACWPTVSCLRLTGNVHKDPMDSFESAIALIATMNQNLYLL